MRGDLLISRDTDITRYTLAYGLCLYLSDLARDFDRVIAIRGR